MSKFNTDQRLAIHHRDGPALIIAGPGSGKTTVMTNRIVYLIDECGVSPDNILAVTFTRAAAEEMKGRFLKLSSSTLVENSTNDTSEGISKNNQTSSEVSFGTFHSIFLKILKTYTNTSNIRLADNNERIDILKSLLFEHYADIRPTGDFLLSLISEFSCIKNGVKKWDRDKLSGKLLPEYDRAMHKKGLIDFDDMLLLCLRLLKKDRRLLNLLRDKYKYIMLDEFQDINRLQFEIIRLLAHPLNNLFAVGDDDQSIYRFRGSDPSIMLSFSQFYSNYRHIILKTNYRSDSSIVNSALKLIAYNKFRYKKNLTAFNREKGYIDIRCFKNIVCEADALRNSIYEENPEISIAILFRTHRAGVIAKRLLDEDAGLRDRNISLMTFHASKGLEFDIVYIINAIESISPGNVCNAEELEEERRMFYVAVTRAKHKLHIFYTKSYYNTQSKRSRFVYELM